MLNLLKLIFVSAIGILVIGTIYIVYNGLNFSVYSTEEFDRSFSQIQRINPKDEYVIVEQINGETFNKTEFRNLFGKFPVGDTEATLSLVANYKYYIKLSELTHDLNERTLTINIKALYLSTPVAFHSSSLVEASVSNYFGKDPDELLAELRGEVSSVLQSKGKAQMNNVRDKAAQTLADNFNSYLSNNGLSRYYDEILINFEDDKTGPDPKFVFNNGFCDRMPCKFEFEFAEGKTIILE